MRVTTGQKEFWIHDRKAIANYQHLIIVNAGLTLSMHNSTSNGEYKCEILEVTKEQISKFKYLYPELVEKLLSIKSSVLVRMSAKNKQVWEELFKNINDGEDASLTNHRELALLLSLAIEGKGNILFVDVESNIIDRVSQLVMLNLQKKWTVSEISNLLSMSESTLRRKLIIEGSSFRYILENIRLNTSLGLIQNTRESISKIAYLCGYKSHSTFSLRFRKKFGITPNSLR